jgi:hypothetical protein
MRPGDDRGGRRLRGAPPRLSTHPGRRSDAVPARRGGRTDAGGDVQLAQDVSRVDLHRLGTDMQPPGDLPVARTGHEQLPAPRPPEASASPRSAAWRQRPCPVVTLAMRSSGVRSCRSPRPHRRSPNRRSVSLSEDAASATCRCRVQAPDDGSRTGCASRGPWALHGPQGWHPEQQDARRCPWLGVGCAPVIKELETLPPSFAARRARTGEPSRGRLALFVAHAAARRCHRRPTSERQGPD